MRHWSDISSGKRRLASGPLCMSTPCCMDISITCHVNLSCYCNRIFLLFRKNNDCVYGRWKYKVPTSTQKLFYRWPLQNWNNKLNHLWEYKSIGTINIYLCTILSNLQANVSRNDLLRKWSDIQKVRARGILIGRPDTNSCLDTSTYCRTSLIDLAISSCVRLSVLWIKQNKLHYDINLG